MSNKSTLSSIITIVLVVLGLATAIFGGYKILERFGLVNSRASLTADSLYGNAAVFVDGNEVGTTPLEEVEVRSGENRVRFENETMTYEVALNFLAETNRSFEVALIRDLGISEVFSAGKNLWFEEKASNTVLSVISDPDGASVYIDNNRVGTTPFSTSELTEGEYSLRVTKTGHESQAARISIDPDYQLNVSAKLFPLPVSSSVNLLADASSLYDVPSDNPLVTANTQDWVNAIIYWNETRGIDLGGVGINKDLVFDFFVDYKGDVYDRNGEAVLTPEDLSNTERGAYLRRISDGPALTSEAQAALEELEIVGGKTATINFTGTGWLNVRSQPSLDGEILVRANVGETYPVLEEATEWVRIRLPEENIEGWVSTTYVTINEQ